MTSPEYAQIALAGVAVLGAFTAILKFVLAPHIQGQIVKTITETAGAQLREVPRLITAVNALTGTIERETKDRQELVSSLNRLTERVSQVAVDLGKVSGRQDTLEKIVAAKRERRTERKHT